MQLVLLLYNDAEFDGLSEEVILPENLEIEVIRVPAYKSKIKVWEKAFELVLKNEPDLHYLRSSTYFPGLGNVAKKIRKKVLNMV